MRPISSCAKRNTSAGAVGSICVECRTSWVTASVRSADASTRPKSSVASLILVKALCTILSISAKPWVTS